MRSGLPVPESVHVHPFDYTVSTDRGELLEACHDNLTSLLGHTSHRDLRIVLDVGAAPAMVAETLLHEILHTLMVTTGLQEEVGDAEEGFVTRLSPVLLALLRDNPDVVAYLTA